MTQNEPEHKLAYWEPPEGFWDVTPPEGFASIAYNEATGEFELNTELIVVEGVETRTTDKIVSNPYNAWIAGDE